MPEHHAEVRKTLGLRVGLNVGNAETNGCWPGLADALYQNSTSSAPADTAPAVGTAVGPADGGVVGSGVGLRVGGWVGTLVVRGCAE